MKTMKTMKWPTTVKFTIRDVTYTAKYVGKDPEDPTLLAVFLIDHEEGIPLCVYYDNGKFVPHEEDVSVFADILSETQTKGTK